MQETETPASIACSNKQLVSQLLWDAHQLLLSELFVFDDNIIQMRKVTLWETCFLSIFQSKVLLLPRTICQSHTDIT